MDGSIDNFFRLKKIVPQPRRGLQTLVNLAPAQGHAMIHHFPTHSALIFASPQAFLCGRAGKEDTTL